MNPVDVPQYMSRFMDKYRFRETQEPVDQKVCYLQKWMTVDSINLQLISNYGPVSLQLKTIDGVSVGGSLAFVTGQQDFFRPGYYIRSISQPLIAYPPGTYYWQLSAGGSDVWVSEPQEIYETLPQSLYFQYKHYERYGDVIFQTGYEGAIRVEGVLKFTTPGSKDTVYEDQPLNVTMIKSVPFRVFNLILGNTRGLPPWLVDKINWILGCSDMRIDGRYYTRGEDSEIELNESELYPLMGMSIQLREKLNRSSIAYQDDSVVQGLAATTSIINTKGFGLSPGEDYVEIENVE